MRKNYKVKIVIDDDVQNKYLIKDPTEIKFLIMIYLNDPDGWVSRGYSFELTEKNYDVIIRLSTSKTIDEICGESKQLSCAILGGTDMYLNSERWFHGSKESKLDLEDYRQYMVSHEIGHILGVEHTNCPCVGCRAPIMMQQTLGIGKCIPNTKITDGP